MDASLTLAAYEAVSRSKHLARAERFARALVAGSVSALAVTTPFVEGALRASPGCTSFGCTKLAVPIWLY